MLRRTMLWGSIIGLLLLLGTCGPRWIWGPKMEAVELHPRDLALTLVVNGRVLAPRRVQLGVQQTGIVARRLVDEGDRVQAGQLLLELDGAEFKASLTQAQARLAQVHEVEQPTNRSNLSQADSTLRQAQWLHERNQRLLKEGILSQSQLEDSRKALELAQAAHVSAQAQSRSSAIGSDLKLAEANVAFAQAKLAQTRIIAPTKGVVLTRSVEVGDQVQPGKLLFTLALDEPLQLLIQPDERNLSQLKVGQEALASADAFPDRRFPARITYLAPGVDATRGTVDVKLDLPQMPDFLRPDMTVSVEIRYGQSKGALALPLRALRSAAMPYALVLRSGRAVRVPVQLGQRGEREVEVVEGLKSGDIILLEPSVKEGSRYRARLKVSP
jgi:HlyD family secretion protein